MLEDAKLWLLRHGIADGKRDENSYTDDFVRMLTPKGAKQAIRAGKLLEHLGEKPAAVYTSPRVRCLQTAQLACAAFGSDCQPQRKKVLDEVAERHPNQAMALAEDGATVLLFGHGPEWEAVIKHCTGRTITPERGSLVLLHFRKGQAKLEQLLTPADIKRLVGGPKSLTRLLDWHFDEDASSKPRALKRKPGGART